MRPTIRLAGLNPSGTNLYVYNRGNAVFDLSAGNDRWNINANISYFGGTLTVKGAPSGASSQTLMGNELVGYGQSKIVIDPNGGSGTTLTLGNAWKSSGGGVNGGPFFVDLSAPGAALVSSVFTSQNGLIGWQSSGYWSGPIVKDPTRIDFGSTNSSGQVVCYAGAAPLLPTSNNNNTNYVASGTLTMNAGTHKMYTLKLDASSQPGFLDLNTTTLNSGGIGTLMVGTNDYTVSNGSLSGSPFVQQYGSGTLTLDVIVSNSIAKSGPGRLALTRTNVFSELTICDGVVQAADGVGLPTNAILRLIGGVFQSHGSMTRTCSGNSIYAGNVSWRPNNGGGCGGRGGGFAAQGGPLTVNLSTNDVNTNAVPNAVLAWGGGWGIGFVDIGQALILGSSSADSLLDWQNGINFGSTKQLREIQVDDNPACTTDIAQMSGVLSGTAGGLLKSGDGTLRLTAANTYAGPTVVNAGTLLVNGSLNAATEAVTVYGGTLGGNGTISRAVRVQPGAMLMPGEGGAGALAISGDVKICGTNLMTGTASLTCATTCTLDSGATLAWGAGATGGITVNGVLTLPATASVNFGGRLSAPLVLAQSANTIVGSPAAWTVTPSSVARVSLSSDAKQIVAVPATMGTATLFY